jgi:hypothetical protein
VPSNPRPTRTTAEACDTALCARRYKHLLLLLLLLLLL